MAKNYDYELSTVNLVHFNNIKYLFETFSVSYSSSTSIDDDAKIYEISYSEDDIDACVNKDEFLDKLEDLAIRYNL